MQNLYTFLLLVITLPVLAQHKQRLSSTDLDKFRLLEQEMIILGDSLTQSKSDSVRGVAAHDMIRKLVTLLKEPNSYLFNFDSLKSISILRAPDDSFKVFTWYWVRDWGAYRHYGCLQRNNPNKLEVYPLFDDSDYQEDSECINTGNKSWYGALYYQIFKKTTVDNRSRYVLLGWDGNDLYSQKKVIDVVKFWGDSLVFGGPFFEIYGELKNRVIFEYKKDANMTVRFQEVDDMIIFDHLGHNTKYVRPEDFILLDGFLLLPDGTTDGLYFDDGVFRTKENVYSKEVGKGDDK